LLSGTVSRLELPLEEGKSRQPFRCRAEHPRGGRGAQVDNPGPSAPLTPEVTLHPPSREEFQGPFRNATLLCRVRGPARAPIRWLRNGDPLEVAGVAGIAGSGAVVTSSRPEVTEVAEIAGSGAVVTSSRLAVTEAEWERGDTFTCQAAGESRNTSKGLECA
ncbi:IGHM protein, partial [Neopipo cinnamomea]|nr:IGHM protein [Neopipo cinnamomea]